MPLLSSTHVSHPARSDPAVEISGAGPAGLAAALTVARAGRRAIVYERAHHVGARFHNDFQGLENWTTQGDVLEELASLGIDTTFDCRPFGQAVLFDPSGREYVYRSDRPVFYLIRRGSAARTLDSALRDQALQAGVDIRFNETCRHLPNGGIVTEGPHGADVVAVGYVFETSAADGALSAVSDRLAPKGYAYCLTWNGRGTVASCMFDDFHNEGTYLQRTVEFFEEHAGLAMTRPRRFGGIGNVVVPQSARQGGLLFAGEAAGFQDALWGFGMRYALVSGHLAARAFVEGRPEDYDRLWSNRLGGLLRTGIVNRYLYARLGEQGYVSFARGIGRSPDVRGWLFRHYNPSLLKRIMAPVVRRRVSTRRQAVACAREGCDCTWCRCQHAAGA